MMFNSLIVYTLFVCFHYFFKPSGFSHIQKRGGPDPPSSKCQPEITNWPNPLTPFLKKKLNFALAFSTPLFEMLFCWAPLFKMKVRIKGNNLNIWKGKK